MEQYKAWSIWFCSLTCTVWLLFHSLFTQILVDCKMNTKNVKKKNNYKQKAFRDIFGQPHTQEYKATKKKHIMKQQLNKKKSKESQTKLMSWYWKRKSSRRKDLIKYNSHPWIMFFLIDWLSFEKDGGFVWNWTSKVKGVEEFWTYMNKGGASRKVDNFHERHMCIIT